MLRIAFFTLLERKILRLRQLRLGPNKLLFLGIFQPFADGLKLFLKENKKEFNLNIIYYKFFPYLGLVLILIYWIIFNKNFIENFIFRIIFFILVSSVRIFPIIGRGWASNSKYALLGAYRSISQVISYEVGIIFLLICFFLIIKNFRIIFLNSKNIFRLYLIFGNLVLFFLWTTVIIAELNRAPFDFAEGESELVSGFNVEYGSLKFAFLFLREYGNIIFISYLTTLIFFKINYFYIIIIIIIIVWIRAVFPRFRYDNLIYLNWKIFLPLILLFFITTITFYRF